MIVTLTPNPSIDRTVTLTGELERGAVLRAASVIAQAGGKGVNISRACLEADVPTTAVLPCAADDAFALELGHAGIPHDLVPVDGEVRVNLTISEPDGTTTKVNSPGIPVTADVLAELGTRLHALAAEADWVVLAGSLPPGAPEAWYADLVADLRGTTRVAVDTSDAPLAALVDRLDGGAPHLMKPNGHELASLTGGGLDGDALEADPHAAAAAAVELLDRGVEVVLVTLGGHGAALVTTDTTGEPVAWHATPPPTEVVSTVGAGDSSLFGYLLARLREMPDEDALALAVAYGSAAAALPGTTIPHPTDVRPDLVAVRPLPLPARTPTGTPVPHLERDPWPT